MRLESRRRKRRLAPGGVEVPPRRNKAIAAHQSCDSPEEPTSRLIGTSVGGALKRPTRTQSDRRRMVVERLNRLTQSVLIFGEGFIPPPVGLRRRGDSAREPGMDDFMSKSRLRGGGRMAILHAT